MLTLSVSAITFSIACAMAFSASDYFRKAVPAACAAPLLLFYMVSGQVPILAVWLWLSGDFNISATYITPAIAAALIGLAANLLLIAAVRQSPLSLMIPLLGAIPAVTAVFSGFILGEWPSSQQAIGIALITAGLIALYSPSNEKFSFGTLWKNIRRERGTRPMAGVVILWALAPPLDKICVELSSVGAHGLIQLFLIGVMTGVWVFLIGGFKAFVAPRAVVRPLAGAAMTAGLAYGFQLAAYQIALVAIVELFKRAIGMVGSLIFGRIMFGEKITSPKIVGIGIMATGLPFIILS
jgi:drug/metabolite transporter (DMT)-like permease